MSNIADELLEASNRQIDRLEAANARLRAINAELVAALENMLQPIGPDSVDDIDRFMRDGDAITEQARLVLAKAKGEQT